MRTAFCCAMAALLFAAVRVQAAGDPAAGEVVYNKSCKMCHASGMMNAPRVGDATAWSDRIAKGEEALFESTKNGLRKMPPKGACASCSDADLRNAVTYMVSRSQ